MCTKMFTGYRWDIRRSYGEGKTESIIITIFNLILYMTALTRREVTSGWLVSEEQGPGQEFWGIPCNVLSGKASMVQDPEIHPTSQALAPPNGLRWVGERKILADSSPVACRGDLSPIHTPTIELVHSGGALGGGPSEGLAELRVVSCRTQPTPGQAARQPSWGAQGTCEKTVHLQEVGGNSVALETSCSGILIWQPLGLTIIILKGSL